MTPEEVRVTNPMALEAYLADVIAHPGDPDPDCRTTFTFGFVPDGWAEVTFEEWLVIQANCPALDPFPGDIPDPCGCQDDIDALRADLCEHASHQPGQSHGNHAIPDCDDGGGS